MNAFQQQVLEALDHFTGFMTARIITQWFVEAPDPQAEIDECIGQWRSECEQRFAAISKAEFERTGLINAEGGYFAQVLDDAERRLRTTLEGAVAAHRVELERRCASEAREDVIQ